MSFYVFYKFESFEEAKIVIFQYIEGFYNNKRLHSAIDYMTPAEKEIQLIMQLKNVAFLYHFWLQFHKRLFFIKCNYIKYII